MSEFKTVAQVGEIPNGEGRAFELDDRLVAVFNDNETYRAIDDMCPHMGASLAAGHFDGELVTCPWHAWSFDTRDGTWCDNRRLKIDVFQVRVEGTNIQVAPAPTAESEQDETTNGSKETTDDQPGTSNQESGDDA